MGDSGEEEKVLQDEMVAEEGVKEKMIHSPFPASPEPLLRSEHCEIWEDYWDT